MNESAETPPADMPTDVHTFAVEHQVDGYLPAVLAAARRAFRLAEVKVFLEEDYEVEGLRYIVVLFAGLRMSVEEALAARKEYVRGLFACVPAPLVIHFRSDMEFARGQRLSSPAPTRPAGR